MTRVKTAFVVLCVLGAVAYATSAAAWIQCSTWPNCSHCDKHCCTEPLICYIMTGYTCIQKTDPDTGREYVCMYEARHYWGLWCTHGEPCYCSEFAFADWGTCEEWQ